MQLKAHPLIAEYANRMREQRLAKVPERKKQKSAWNQNRRTRESIEARIWAELKEVFEHLGNLPRNFLLLKSASEGVRPC